MRTEAWDGGGVGGEACGAGGVGRSGVMVMQWMTRGEGEVGIGIRYGIKAGGEGTCGEWSGVE